jgi:hypothetical protein
LAKAVPAAVFGVTVGLFALIGLPVSSLGVTMIFSFAGKPAEIAAISLSAEAGSADAEYEPAPSAGDFDQQQNGYPSSLANTRRNELEWICEMSFWLFAIALL